MHGFCLFKIGFLPVDRVYVDKEALRYIYRINIETLNGNKKHFLSHLGHTHLILIHAVNF